MNEASDEIAELKMNFKRMVQLISQLKEEINAKDQSIQQVDTKNKKYEQENEKLKEECKKIELQIKSSDDLIKTQETDIARLKYVISEAESEKQK